MIKREDIYNQEVLRRLLDYDPETGKITWKERTVGDFCSPRTVKRWNKKHAGKLAFNVEHSAGYFEGSINKLREYAHRVIWLINFGYLPIQVDHIDRDKKNNKLSNLREVTDSENKKNLPLAKSNTSGVTGVYKHSQTDKWVAQININKKTVFLGVFDKFEDAVSVRLAAEIENGYHINHGKKNDNLCN